MVSCALIELSNAFVFIDPELQVINILYGWSGIYDYFKSCPWLFSFVKTFKLKIFVCYKNDIYTV